MRFVVEELLLVVEVRFVAEVLLLVVEVLLLVVKVFLLVEEVPLMVTVPAVVAEEKDPMVDERSMQVRLLVDAVMYHLVQASSQHVPSVWVVADLELPDVVQSIQSLK